MLTGKKTPKNRGTVADNSSDNAPLRRPTGGTEKPGQRDKTNVSSPPARHNP